MQTAEIADQLPMLRVRGGRIGRRDMLGAATAAVGALLAAVFSLQLWRMHLSVPLTYGGHNTFDSIFSLTAVKLAMSGGWVYSNHQLGFPFGMQLYDYPLATDNLSYACMWVIGRFTSNPATVENIFFLLTFPAASVSGYAVLRWLGITLPSAILAAVLFADMPYHLLEGENHLLLSVYVTVPIATYLLVSILDGRRLLTCELRPFGVRSLVSSRNLWIMLLAVVIGSTGVYYAAFTVILLAATGLAVAVTSRRPEPLAEAVVVLIAILAVGYLNDLPTAIYRHEHGKNTAVAARPASDNERYGLTLASMALPVPGDRIGPLNSLRLKYDINTPVISEGPVTALGTLATIGLAWALLSALLLVLKPRAPGSMLRRQTQLGFMTLLAFLLATVGGVSALIAYTLTAQLRSWDRIVVFIDFFALGVLALMLDAVARRWFQDRRLLAAIGLVVLCLFGVFDQSSRNAVPDYKLVTRNWNSDAQFVERIQRTLPRNAAVFELPYVTFPEAVPFNGIQSYDQLRGWLHSTTLSWSFGAMVDRPADWAGQTTALPTRTLLDALVAAGFDGITIDDHGYPGNTSPVTPELEQILHEQPVTAPNGRYLFFDIRHYAAMLRAHVSHAELAGLRTAVLHPPLSTITAGIYGGGVDGTSTWAVNTVQMSVVNHAAKARRVVFYAEVRAAAPGNYTLDVALAGGGRHRFRFSNHQRLLEFALTLAPGASTLTLDTNVPPTLIPGTSAPVSVWYSSPLVVGAAMRPFLPRSAAAALQ